MNIHLAVVVFYTDDSVPVNAVGAFLASVPLVTLGLFFVINLLLPALVDLVTKRFASTKSKALLLLLLQLVTTVVVGFSNARNNGQIFDWLSAGETFITALMAGATSIIAGKPLGIVGADSPIAKILPEHVGIGPVDPVKVAAAQNITEQDNANQVVVDDTGGKK